LTIPANVATYNTSPEADTPVALEPKYIPALDGLRGVAVLLVIGLHYQKPYFELGWTGVDLFFVLSGFLITKRLMENKDRPDRYALFYRNRALRIMPLYYLMLVLFYFCVYFLVSAQNFHRFDLYTNNKAAWFLFLQNWVFDQHEATKEGHLVPLWSLAIEEQFYLIWPWFLYAFYTNKYFRQILWVIIAGVFLIRNGLYFFNGSRNLYTNTFCRIDSLVIGALTWFLVQKPLFTKKVMWMGITALVILMAGYTCIEGKDPRSPFSATVGYTAFAFLFASILYTVVINPGSMASRILKNSFLRFTGKISYGIYVFHVPVIIIARSKISPILQEWHLPENLLLGIISILITYAISIGSYYYYESYFLTRKK